MDGNFVPAISFGPSVITNLRKQFPTVFFDCHMMVATPETQIDAVAEANAKGADGRSLTQFTFHIETTESRGLTQSVIDQVKAAGMRVGIALNPDTPAEAVLKYSEQCDMVLVMTVVPGKGGQSFMEDMMPKVNAVREKHPEIDINVDGGLKPTTVESAAKAGANMIVSGSGIFKADDMAFAISTMKRSIEKHGNGREEAALTPLKYDKDTSGASDDQAQTVANLLEQVKQLQAENAQLRGGAGGSGL